MSSIAASPNKAKASPWATCRSMRPSDSSKISLSTRCCSRGTSLTRFCDSSRPTAKPAVALLFQCPDRRLLTGSIDGHRLALGASGVTIQGLVALATVEDFVADLDHALTH